MSITEATELTEWDVACLLAQALTHAAGHVPEPTDGGEFARDDCRAALDAFQAVYQRRLRNGEVVAVRVEAAT